jgi:hypothetical protein
VAQQGPEYAEWFESELSPQDQFQELFERYSVFRVVDANQAAANGQAAAAVPAEVQAAAASAVQPKGPPVTEGRGGARPQAEPNDDLSLIRRGVAAYSGAKDIFSAPPS